MICFNSNCVVACLIVFTRSRACRRQFLSVIGRFINALTSVHTAPFYFRLFRNSLCNAESAMSAGFQIVACIIGRQQPHPRKRLGYSGGVSRQMLFIYIYFGLSPTRSPIRRNRLCPSPSYIARNSSSPRRFIFPCGIKQSSSVCRVRPT